MKRYIKASWPVIVDDRDFAEDLIAIAETVGVYEDEASINTLIDDLNHHRYNYHIDPLLIRIDDWIQSQAGGIEDPDFVGSVRAEWELLNQYRLDHEDNQLTACTHVRASQYAVMVRNRGMWGIDTYCKDENGNPLTFRTRAEAQRVADEYNNDRGYINNFNHYYVEEI